VLLDDEDGAEFEELEDALFEELALVGALQGFLVGRMARPGAPDRCRRSPARRSGRARDPRAAK
jgi:hypothetical protein